MGIDIGIIGAEKLKDIKDDISMADPGYSFLSDRRNRESNGGIGGAAGLETVFENPKLAEMLFRIVDGKVVWLESGMRKFEKLCVELLEYLLIIFHMVGGQPARGPELTELRYANTVEGIRNIFLILEGIMFVTSSHKGMSTIGWSKFIPRFLPSSVALMYAIYVKYLLPLRLFFKSKMREEEAWVNDGVESEESEDEEEAVCEDDVVPAEVIGSPRNFLFSDDGITPWGSNRLSKIMFRESRIYLGQRIGIQAWRHIAIAISRRFLKGFRMSENEDQDEEDIIDLQAGHTSAVADRIYAIRGDILNSLSEHSIEEFGKISRDWHRLLLGGEGRPVGRELARAGRGRTPMPCVARTKRRGSVIISRSAKRRMVVADLERGASGDGSVVDLETEMMVEPDREEPAAEDTYVANTTRRGRHVEAALSEITVGARRNETIEEKCKRVIVSLFGSDACFRSNEQFDALKAVFQGVSPLVVVLPTGGGKTLLPFGPAKLRNAGVTVVILPYLSLCSDMMRRATEAGIRCHHWRGEAVADVPLLFVTIEGSATSGFKEHVRRLVKGGRLERVVVDEAHMIVHGSTFRISYDNIDWFTSLGVQTVFLTATLPEYMESELGTKARINGATIIRASGRRKNIRYEVRQVREDILDSLEELLDSVSLVGEERCIIYCRSIAQCDLIATKTGCARYYSAWERKEEDFEKWRNGDSRIIAATSAMGAGIDLPMVKMVIHAGIPWGLVDYAQESGRAGRNGMPAFSYILWEYKQLLYKVKEDNVFDEESVRSFVQSRSCRRRELGLHFDNEDRSCVSGVDVFCDNCEKSPGTRRDRLTGFSIARVDDRDEQRGGDLRTPAATGIQSLDNIRQAKEPLTGERGRVVGFNIAGTSIASPRENDGLRRPMEKPGQGSGVAERTPLQLWERFGVDEPGSLREIPRRRPRQGSGVAEWTPLRFRERPEVEGPGAPREVPGRILRRESPEASSSQMVPTNTTKKVAEVGSRTTLKAGPLPDDGGDRYVKRKRNGAMWDQVRQKLAKGSDCCRFCFAIAPGGGSIRHEPAECRICGNNGIDMEEFGRFRELMRFQNYAACFNCWLPQKLCSEEGSKSCIWDPDTVAPILYAVMFRPALWKKIKRLMGRDGEVGVEEYITWSGVKIKDHFGINSSRAMKVVLLVLGFEKEAATASK